MQADRGLVQHVEHAGQARADLRGEADALALAAGERAGVARERQVVEPDVDQEIQALADLLQDAAGDLVLLLVQRGGELVEPVARGADGIFGDLRRCRVRAIFTASASGFRRLPWQTSQGCAEKKRPISSRTQAESVSFQRRSRFGMTPSKAFFVS